MADGAHADANAAAERYAERGFGRRSGAGSRPALVVVDLVNGFTDPASPLWCDADAAVAAAEDQLRRARLELLNALGRFP